MLVAVLATFAAAATGAPPALQFALSVVAVIPLAAFIGSATEALAERVGGRVGGLLNATFGNAPDLLVGVFGVQKGLFLLVKATLIGALMSNSALIMGFCYVLAGLRFGRPRFSRHEAGHHSVLMMLTLAAVLFPSVGSLVVCQGVHCANSASRDSIQHVSVGIGAVLLVTYCAYIAYSIFGLGQIPNRQGDGRQAREAEIVGKELRPIWPTWFSFLVLCGATIALVPVTDILTGSVSGVTSVLGWSQVFVGIIVVANAGNVAEGYAALRLAYRRGGLDPDEDDSGLDLALGIASASSIQIATFVAPVVVLYSLLTHPMNLVFSPVELAIFGLLVIIFTYIAHDGESNWLEGTELLALYLMAAIVFFALPGNAFGG